MSEWILFAGVLQTAVYESDPLRVVLFGFGILTTVLTSAYILWMYKRIFFGKIPERLVGVKDSNRYITGTMAVLAGLTLIFGVYPDPILNPLTGYIDSIFPPNSGVSQLPTHTKDVPGEQQEKLGLQQSNLIGSHSGLFDANSKSDSPLTLHEGKTNGEGDLKESSPMLERTILISNQTGASK
jgi:NADH:ubiquinone oxidoreductase subunit 5 (subunit L)/multisubunit Na+/H+ antiporter MnhA subunit